MAKKKPKSKVKKPPQNDNPPNVTNIENEEVASAFVTSAHQTMLPKMCRLCENKDGPFLNIFDPETLTAKKIQDLMPFSILENDNLPHKICFRCSAKVEELHEFVQKCVRTQDSLQVTLGKMKSMPKTKTRIGKNQWEDKLNKSNISNEEICNALIKKAMEGIKDISMNITSESESTSSGGKWPLAKAKSNIDAPVVEKKEYSSDFKLDVNDNSNTSIKKVKLTMEKCDAKLSVTRSLRYKNSSNDTEKIADPTPKIDEVIEINEKTEQNISRTRPNLTNQKNLDIKHKEENLPQKEKVSEPVKAAPPFNIMDYITTIKVNGVGILFQCKLCNRNFLKKEVVEVHGCARNGAPKTDLIKPILPPEPPKVLSTVKYIDSKHNIDIKKNSNLLSEKNEMCSDNVPIKVKTPVSKPKPKIGPASKVKRDNTELQQTQSVLKQNTETSDELSTKKTIPQANNSYPEVPIVNFPGLPSMNNRFKLIPGPNNVFTLVEESNFAKNRDEQKNNEILKTTFLGDSSKLKYIDANTPSPVIIDLEEDNNKPSSSKQQPYPVGLFQTRHGLPSLGTLNYSETPVSAPPLKKPSYSVVQTDNPNKLVISTKQVEDVPKKRLKKTKNETSNGGLKEPFNVTLEDVAPPKDTGFFTFINVDPLLQPSYVLPTDNIIQESQISTSTPAVSNPQTKDTNYTCSICNDTFSREKKLLSHIKSHFTKLDFTEESNDSKKRKLKS